MSKPKNIAEQIEELQRDTEKLKDYQKLLEKALKIEFGAGRNEIEKALQKGTGTVSDFERKICQFFSLNSVEDRSQFLATICSDSTRNFFEKRRENPEE